MKLIKQWDDWMNRKIPGREARYSAVQHTGYLAVTLTALAGSIGVLAWAYRVIDAL